MTDHLAALAVVSGAAPVPAALLAVVGSHQRCSSRTAPFGAELLAALYATKEEAHGCSDRKASAYEENA